MGLTPESLTKLSNFLAYLVKTTPQAAMQLQPRQKKAGNKRREPKNTLCQQQVWPCDAAKEFRVSSLANEWVEGSGKFLLERAFFGQAMRRIGRNRPVAHQKDAARLVGFVCALFAVRRAGLEVRSEHFPGPLIGETLDH